MTTEKTNDKNTTGEITRVSVALPVDVAQDIKTLAFIQDVSASKLGVEAFRAYADAHRAEIDRVNGVLSK